jgi:hypothetical protein
VDPSFFPIPAYQSAAEAIAAETATQRAARSAKESSLVTGSFIEAFGSTDQQVALYLTNGHILQVNVIQEGLVEWTVSKGAASGGTVGEDCFASMDLVWPSNRTTRWSPGGILATRLQFPIDKLFAGQIFVNIYFERGGVLQFLPLWNRSEQSALLYISELEPPV